VNIHTRFVGAFDAIILSLHAALMIAMLLALLDPTYDGGRSNATVIQHPAAASLYVVDADTAGVSRHL
jgi:hypothetical protein